jgi:hypothetical protein
MAYALATAIAETDKATATAAPPGPRPDDATTTATGDHILRRLQTRLAHAFGYGRLNGCGR